MFVGGKSSGKLNIAVLALSVNGAMGQYLHCWLEALGGRASVTLVAPAHYNYQPRGYRLSSFVTGMTKARAAAALLNPLGIVAVFRKIRECQPDVAHLFSGEGYPAALLSPAALRRQGVPLVTTVHDVHPHSGDLLMQAVARLRRCLLHSSRFVHVHSERHRPALVSQGLPAAQVRVIPHGSFAPIYNPCGETRPEPTGRTVLFFGRLQAYKGIDTLVEAARYLDRDLRILIAGPGLLAPELSRRISADPRFELHNRFLPDSEVTALFRQASVTVLPYRDATQSSVPLISASFGVPVVASAVGAFLEDVPRIGGLLVPPGDPAALAGAIARSFGQPAFHPPELHFSALADQFLEMYSEAAS